MPRRRKKIQEEFPYEATAVINMDDIYAVINYVQLSRKNCSFIADTDDSITMEHLFKDCEISFSKLPDPSGVKYSLEPPPVNAIPEEAFLIDEDYDDEITEEGQCF
tara:strand:+ start:418745 stop:419062 length:318 start_codon:yes stop_codon:yes gene_type:complete